MTQDNQGPKQSMAVEHQNTVTPPRGTLPSHRKTVGRTMTSAREVGRTETAAQVSQAHFHRTPSCWALLARTDEQRAAREGVLLGVPGPALLLSGDKDPFLERDAGRLTRLAKRAAPEGVHRDLPDECGRAPRPICRTFRK